MSIKKAVLFIFVALIAGGIFTLSTNKPKMQTLKFQNGKTINIEIADTPTKQATGLMFRTTLDENSGMLFIFDETAKHLFWMKNTYIPLDMLWIDENFKIVDIKQDVKPCAKDEKCPLYMPDSPAKYVLEVNSGFSAKNGLKIGDTVTYPN